jgi:AcrR family transcriptional regulator
MVAEPSVTQTGLRARKRRETGKRIADNAIRLFVSQGYEATTLDAIAAAAGISRRTFFSYFKSKDDILLSLQSGLGEALAAAVRRAPPGQRPIDAARQALVDTCAGYNGEEMLKIDALMRSSAAVQARKQASYIEHERALYAGLRERWPEPEREASLRVVAMLSIGSLRLSLDAWSRARGERPIEAFIDETFAALEADVRAR